MWIKIIVIEITNICINVELSLASLRALLTFYGCFESNFQIINNKVEMIGIEIREPIASENASLRLTAIYLLDWGITYSMH